MIVILKPHSSKKDVALIENRVRESGYEPHTIYGETRTVVAAVGDETTHSTLERLISLPMVENVMPVQKRYKLISRETHAEDGVVGAGGVEIGGEAIRVIAGPCSVESSETLLSTAAAVKRAGAVMLRGGAFKPRTSPYDFQGLGEEGLEILAQAKKKTGLPVVTEVVSEPDVKAVARVADMLQIGARNALNYALLEACADTGKPVLLKRGLAATINEWLLAGEYIVKRGNRNVVLCERGIRTFESTTRNTLDVGAIAYAKQQTSLPVIADPSHAAGRWDLVIPLACAAIAAGADGLLIEVHPDPEKAMSDNAQQLTFEGFDTCMKRIRPFVKAAGRKI